MLRNDVEMTCPPFPQTSACSADEVREVITAVEPQAVMLELCPSRYAAMFPNRRHMELSGGQAQQRTEDPTDRAESPEVLVDQGTRTVNVVLRNINQLMAFLGMKPGCDFVAAVAAARPVGARLVLGDRDAFDTMERIARLKHVSELFDVQQIVDGLGGLRDAVRPAAGGRVWLPSVLLLPRRILEALPILSIPAVALWISAALAWSTESVFGVTR